MLSVFAMQMLHSLVRDPSSRSVSRHQVTLHTGIVSRDQQGRIQSNVVGGVPELLTARSAVERVRPRQREALAEGAAAGVWGRKNRSPRVLECT